MRPLEIVLSIANLLALAAAAVPRLGAVSWARYLAPSALAIAVVQVLVEGARWQMVPAYVLSALLFVVRLARGHAPLVARRRTCRTRSAASFQMPAPG